MAEIFKVLYEVQVFMKVLLVKIYLDFFRHTGQLESFNNVVLAYAPKRAAFQ